MAFDVVVLNPSQRRVLSRERTSPTLAKQGASNEVQGVETGTWRVIFMRGTVSCGVLGGWEHDSMAVVRGEWAWRARWGDGPVFVQRLPVGGRFQPSIISPASGKVQAVKSGNFAGPTSSIHFKFAGHGYFRFESCPILAAPVCRIFAGHVND
jgi:hypothetical protein